MNLDSRGRTTGERLVSAIYADLDLVGLRAGLEQRQTRRTRTRVSLVGFMAVALVLGGWIATRSDPNVSPAPPLNPSPSRSAQPADVVPPNGPIVVVQLEGDRNILRAVTPGGAPYRFADSDEFPAITEPGVGPQIDVNQYGPGIDSPSWSADGKVLAFVADDTIYVSNQTYGVRQVLKDQVRPVICSGCEIAVSPDGSRIAYANSEGVGFLDFRLDVANGTGEASDTRVARSPAGSPSWSPDGQSIAFMDERGIVSIGVDGSDERVVASGDEYIVPANSDGPYAAQWSPDGATIAFLTVGGLSEGGAITVATVPAGGGPVSTIGYAGSCACALSPPDLAWSPDSSQFAVTAVLNEGLVLLDNVPGSDVRVLDVPAFEVAWRPIPTPKS